MWVMREETLYAVIDKFSIETLRDRQDTYRWRIRPGEGRLRGQEWKVRLRSLSEGLGMELRFDGMPALPLPFNK